MFKGCVKDVKKAETLVKCAHLPCQSQSTESAEPPKKKAKVDRCDMDNRKIMERSCLDLSINLAQQLLKRQFPKVNELQSTLSQFKKCVGKPPKNQLQIIHSRGDHWIVASTVGCKGSEVLVYDSVYCTLDKATTDVIANLFSSSEDDGLSKAGRRNRLVYLP